MKKFEVHNKEIHDSLTERQWALKGFMLKESAVGTKMYANHIYQDAITYYGPHEVRKASEEEITEFFRPEKERRNELARLRRAEKRREKQERRLELERWEIFVKQHKPLEEQRKVTEAICQAIHPLLKQLEALKSRHKAVVIDAETTGLDIRWDEILQLSIISIDGDVLFDSYFKPVAAESWEEAELVNGISPMMVENAPDLAEKIAEINEILYFSDVIIGYNIDFDSGFLDYAGVICSENTKYRDVMLEFAPIYGEWSKYFRNYKWQKLTTAADYYQFDWGSVPDGAHNSLTDCFATLHVYKNIHENLANNGDSEGEGGMREVDENTERN